MKKIIKTNEFGLDEELFILCDGDVEALRGLAMFANGANIGRGSAKEDSMRESYMFLVESYLDLILDDAHDEGERFKVELRKGVGYETE